MTDPPADRPGPLVEARGVVRWFPVGRTLFGKPHRLLRAVDGVSLAIPQGKTMGLVGESGCGKSTLGRLLIRTLQPDAGEIRFEGQDISHLGREPMRRLRRRFQMVFQDPMGSLDPRMRIGEQCGRAASHRRRPQPAGTTRAGARDTGTGRISARSCRSLPARFSGGQRQRICIARALVLRPDFIVADEPVSALDVSVRAQVINLFAEVQARFGLTYLFVFALVVRHSLIRSPSCIWEGS